MALYPLARELLGFPNVFEKCKALTGVLNNGFIMTWTTQSTQSLMLSGIKAMFHEISVFTYIALL